MAKYLLSHFGELDTNNLDVYYEANIKFNSHEIKVDLNFNDGTVDISHLTIVKRFIDDLMQYDKKNAEYIKQDFVSKNQEAVRNYIQHHLEELSKEDLINIIDFNNENMPLGVQLIQALKLVRVGFYPNNDSQFAIFDYSIGQELTQYLIVVQIDKNGNLNSISMES